jgi:hypothetical protein
VEHRVPGPLPRPDELPLNPFTLGDQLAVITEPCGARLVTEMAQPTDSRATKADRVQIQLLRAAGMGRRAALARSLSASVIQLSREAIRKRHPEYDERDVLLAFAELHYGKQLAAQVRRFLERRRDDPA